MLDKLQKLKWGNKKQEPAVPNPPPAQTPPPATNQVDNAARLSDSSEKKRLAACLEIKDTDLLLQTSRTDHSDKVRQTAARQYARHLPAGEPTIQLLNTYRESPDERHLARLITALHNDANIRNQGIAQFSSDADYMDIAIETRFHDTRDVVTDKIQSLDVIDKVWRNIKSKDKVVARKLKERLSEHQKNEQVKQTQLSEVDKVIEEMDKLANGVWSPNFTNRYDLFAAKWDALDFAIDPQHQSTYESLRTQAHDKVESNRALSKLHEAQETCIAELNSASNALQQCEVANLETTLQTTTAQLQNTKATWQELSATDKSLAKVYTTACRKLESRIATARATQQAFAAANDLEQSNTPLLKKHHSQLHKVAEQLAAQNEHPLYAKELPNLLQNLDSCLKKQQQADSELKGSIHKQFASLNSAISANKWGPAKSIHERLSKKIARLPEKDQTALTDKLQRLEKRLTDLGDWKQFATDPKLENLCEQMEKLPELKLPPKDQADRIKDLQSQWKAMGASPAQEKHWPRFKTAADIAFEPCAKYFSQVRAEKESKLAAREQMLQMLQDYVEKSAWDNPDWKLVEKTIRTAKSEWSKLRVYDRKATAPQEEKFTQVLAALNEKLEPAYEAGNQEKQDLIDKVVTLGEGEINQHCINQVKRLQSMWRRTGVVKRADDQRLWKTFNEACREIYNTHRDMQREQYKTSVEHVTRAKEIIRALRNAGNGETFDEKQLQLLQDEFQTLPEFPEKEQKFLFRDFNRAVDGLDKQRQKHSESALSKEVQRLHQNASICDQLEALAGGNTESIATDLQRLTDEWDDGEKTDNVEWKKAMNLRKDSIVAHLQAGTLPDFDANTLARRLLCVDLEILLEKETPAEDKPLRMQHQLEQLQQGMTSRAVASVNEQKRALEVKWLTAFPAQAGVRDKLNTRFATALGKNTG